MTNSLADALTAQIERVSNKRDKWMAMAKEHPEMASGITLAIALMQHEIMAGVRAAASNDVAAMRAAHEALAAYSDSD